MRRDSYCGFSPLLAIRYWKQSSRSNLVRTLRLGIVYGVKFQGILRRSGAVCSASYVLITSIEILIELGNNGNTWLISYGY